MTKDKGMTRFKAAGALCLLIISSVVSVAQPKSPVPPAPKPLPPAEAESEARTLVANLLAQKPEKNSTNTGKVKVRSGDKEREISVQFEIVSTPTKWVSIYQTINSGSEAGGTKLTVRHSENRPNQYWLIEGNGRE